MTRAEYACLEAYMRSCAADSAHDREHIYRVLHQAMAIARTEPTANLDVLTAACLLHDICRPEQLADPSVCHALAGAEKALGFLREQGFAEAFSRHVADCIRTHRFRRNDPPRSIEAKILFDADKLDVTGAIGIARTLLYRATAEEPLYTRLPDGSLCDGSGDAPPSFFREYQFKLSRLYDRFYTPEGKRLALQRQHAAQSFFDSLRREILSSDEAGKEALEMLLSKCE